MKAQHVVGLLLLALIIAVAGGVTYLVQMDAPTPQWLAPFVAGEHGGLGTFSLIFIVLALGFYFLPAIVAGPNHPRLGLVVMVNLFSGWTVLGWIAALLIALLARQSAAQGSGTPVK